MPVTATVFREGHDAVAATACSSTPTGRAHPRRDAPARTRHRPLGRDVVPDREGRWTFRVEGWSDPLGTWEHAALIKVPAGSGPRAGLRGGRARPGARPGRARASGEADRQTLADAVRALRDTGIDPPERLRPAPALPCTAVLARAPAARPRDREPELPAAGAARARPVQRLVRALPALRGGARRPATGRGSSAPSRRPRERLPAVARHGLRRRLPAARSTRSARSNRKGPNNTLTPRPTTPARRGRSARRRAATTPIHPDLGTIEDFDDFVAAPRGLGPGGRARLRAAVLARPPVGTRAPGVVHHPGRRHDRVRREPAEEVPGHLPDELRQRPRGHLPPRCCGSCGSGSSHGVTVFRVDNPHTKPVEFWEWLIGRGQRRTDPEVIFLAEAFTRPAMMHTLAKVGFTQSLHVLHLAQRELPSCAST